MMNPRGLWEGSPALHSEAWVQPWSLTRSIYTAHVLGTMPLGATEWSEHIFWFLIVSIIEFSIPVDGQKIL